MDLVRRTAAVALLATAVAPLAPHAASLTRQPYLQSVTQTGATIAFRTDESCPVAVHVSAPGAEHEVRSTAPATVHALQVTGLAPGTTYGYSVEACGTTVASGKRLRTAPPSGAREVHFVALADTGIPGSSQTAVARAVEASDPELIIGAGDVGYPEGTEAEIQSLFAAYASVFDEVPFYNALGNHEYTTAKAGPMLANLHLPTNNAHRTERYYSFDWGHVHFVALDSNCSGADATPECTNPLQQQWLEEDLSATTAAFKVVFFHHPPWSSGYHGSSTAMRRTFGPILEKYGVDLVVNGHDHDYERSKPMKGDEVVPAGTAGAVTYVVVGNGGVKLRSFPVAQPSWTAYRNATDFGFLDVKVVDGQLSAEMLSTSGAVLDRFTISKELPSRAIAGSGAPAEGSPSGGVAAADAASGGGCSSAGGTTAILGLATLAAARLMARMRGRRQG